MAWPSDLTRTKNWGTEILTDSDLEGQFDLIINYIDAMMDGTSGHAHTGSANDGKLITLTTGVTGVLPLANGGTANSGLTATLGDLYYGDGTKVAKLAGNITTTKQLITQTGDGAASAAPILENVGSIVKTSDSVDLTTLKIRAINFNGSTGSTTVNKTVGGSHTVVRNATGQWTITWASAFADVYYIVSATGAGQTSQPGDFYLSVTDKSTTTCKIWALNSGGSAVDIVSGQVDVHAIGT